MLKKNTYYLTLFGPMRGERVIASVSTDDRLLSEKLFSCGRYNEKGFCFNGLYTEEEVLHMFRPGSDITGTFHPQTGSCEIHRDYHDVPSFEVDNKKVYRIKDGKRLLMDLNVDNSSFDYVRSVLSGKSAVLSVTDVPAQKVSEKIPVVMSASAVVNHNAAPVADNALDLLDAESGDFEFDDEPDTPAKENLSAVYDGINVVRTQSSDENDDFISSFDAMFYDSQKRLVNSDNTFAQDENLRDRFKTDKSELDRNERIRVLMDIKNIK